MGKVLTIGEAMGLLVAMEAKPLEEVEMFSRHVCGAELNYSVGMARLGHDISYITRVGNDPFGKSIGNFLRDNAIGSEYVQVDGAHMTGFQMKAKALGGDPEVANIRKHTAFSQITPEDLRTIDWSNVQHLHVTGIPLALSTSCRATIFAMMEEGRSRGVRVSFDPNLRPMLWPSQQEMKTVINEAASHADIVLPGLSEGKLLTGLKDERAVGAYYLEHGASQVVIKLGGSKGSYIRTSDQESYVTSFKVDHVVDTVGAGDGFAVGLTSALLEGLPIEEAALRGAAIGALAIMSAGDNEGLPTRDELAAFMAKAERAEG
jgi:2-dehydro-3-deoxygluconokinase